VISRARRILAPAVIVAGIAATAAVPAIAVPAMRSAAMASERHSGPVPAPLLSISVGSGQRAVRLGSGYRYTVALRNDGPVTVRGLTIQLMLPPSVRFSAADSGGRLRDGRVRWTVDLPPSRQAVVHADVRAATAPAGPLRLAATACAAQGTSGLPLVCGTGVTGVQTTAAEFGDPQVVIPVGCTVLALLIGAVVFGLARLRRLA
jgi:uncharacterized repeat protein (TIGR01451 family)